MHVFTHCTYLCRSSSIESTTPSTTQHTPTAPQQPATHILNNPGNGNLAASDTLSISA